MYKESNKKIYVTNDYSIFKSLQGNRTVKNPRVIKTMESIQELGWLTEPILVNEKMEVIDGQGRLEALKRLEMPIEFIIEKHIGITECQYLNRYQKNWSTMDYIDSYIAMGNDNYIWLKSTIKIYSQLKCSTIYSVAATKGKSSSIGGGSSYTSLERGVLNLSLKERTDVENALFFLSRFADTIQYLGGRKDVFYSAIMFLYSLDCVDNERLCSAINNARYDGMVSSSTVEGYLQQFERLYNKNLIKKKRVDMVHEYKIA